MATPTPNSIDAFLEHLNLEVGSEPTPQKAPQNLEVRVMFARSNGLHPVIVHLFVLGRGITEKDLEGELIPGQRTFRANSLMEFSELYASSVFGVFGENYDPLEGIKYHEDPPMPTEDYPRVSFRLVTKLDDQKGDQLLGIVRKATIELYRDQH